MLIWLVTGEGLSVLFIEAPNTYDALMVARKKNPGYDRVHFYCNISGEGFLEHYRG